MFWTALLIFASSMPGSAAADGAVRTAAGLAAVNRGEPTSATNFTLTATVVRSGTDIVSDSIFIMDPSGATSLTLAPSFSARSFRAGDVLHLEGSISFLPQTGSEIVACKVEKTGSATLPPVPEITVADALSGRYDFRIVQLVGTVQDAFVDEIDPSYAYLVLLQDGETIYVALPNRLDLGKLPGATVSVTGACDAYRQSHRRHKGRTIGLATPKDLTVLLPAAKDAYSVPDIATAHDATPARIHAFGRLKANGTVIAVWRRDTFLIRTDAGESVRAETIGGSLPAVGDRVEAVGFPETDLYSINLTRAIWRKVGAGTAGADEPQDITAHDLFAPGKSSERMQPRFHGECVRLTGIVRSLPGIAHDGTLYLESDGRTITVNLSACPDAAKDVGIGCRIAVTGICVMEVDRFRPNAAFPRIRGFGIVMRPADSIRVLARPSWWTPGRVWTVFGGLIALLLAALVWNVSLRRLAERRGRELLRRQIEAVKSKLKVEERTRLAVELHDSLSQTLTGVSMEIAAADELKGDVSHEMATHLARADLTLKSCRDELRNCLWDLRSEALDEPDMTRAVLRTLQPHVDRSQLTVRFNVPRSRISDNTAHAILRIIRELVVNALHHGHATAIKVAGSIEPGHLGFSVRDNGCGFVPDDCPGVLQGHFGLQGIGERLERIGGTLTVESRPGEGTRISARIPTHTPTQVGV